MLNLFNLFPPFTSAETQILVTPTFAGAYPFTLGLSGSLGKFTVVRSVAAPAAPLIATQLAIITQPTSSVRGVGIGAIVVEAQNSASVRVNSFVGPISASLNTQVSGSNNARNITLQFTAAGLVPVTSSVIFISA
jgi:hypothetical protein